MRGEDNQSYVYMYFRPCGTPCYVGKGRGKRWLEHERGTTNQRLARIIAKAGGAIPRVKIREGLSDADACRIEIALIAAIGREVHGGPLVNFTDGGEGMRGNVRPASVRKAIGDKLRGRTKADLANEKRQREAAKSSIDEVRMKRRLAQIGKKASAETKEKMRKARVGYKHSDETKRKIGEAHKGRIYGLEARSNMKSAQIKSASYQNRKRINGRFA